MMSGDSAKGAAGPVRKKAVAETQYHDGSSSFILLLLGMKTDRIGADNVFSIS
jgi:hypothetical protein